MRVDLLHVCACEQGSCGIEVAAGATIPRTIIPVAARMAQHLQAINERRAALVAVATVGPREQVLCGSARVQPNRSYLAGKISGLALLAADSC